MTIRSDAPLTAAELQRYHRHLALPDVGESGQRKLKAARVLVVGAGGLGSPAALYVAAAGIGHLGILDADVVELSNLQRQLLHGTRDVGRAKVSSAHDRLADLNPHVHVVTHHTRLTSANALDLLGMYDLILDGTDNFPTRYLLNDACVLLGKPYVYGSASRFEGQVSVLGTADGPCYRCLFREPPAPGQVANCADGGVLGVLPGLVGILQATEAIKLLLGIGDALIGRLLLVDALRMRFREIEVVRDPSCPACSTREITALMDYDVFCGVAAEPPHAVLSDEGTWGDDVTPIALAMRMQGGSAPALLDVREPFEWAIAHIESARLVPLDSLPHAMPSLDPEAELVVYCHSGVRSQAAATWLRNRGFAHVHNLVGGIDRWSLEVDPSVRRY